MADDITLTVRVRDLTRGDLDRVRQRMRGMDGDVRRLAQGSTLASERAQRLGRELEGVSGRLGQLQRTGRMAGSEMQFMRRTMGLLGRDLRLAQRAGELSREEFDALSRQLDETRLGFDRLARDVDRHNAVAQRAHRDAVRRQQQADAMGRMQARAQREDEERTRRIGRIHAQALREDAQREAARIRGIQRMGQLQARAQREDEDRIRRMGRTQAQALREDEQRTAAQMRDIQRRGQLQARAQREDEERMLRMGRMHAQALRMDRQRTAELQRQRQAALRQGVTRLAGGGDDLAARFRGLNDSNVQRMTRALSDLSGELGGVSGSTDRARRNVAALNDDLQVMSQVLRNAQRDGNLSRREFNALANGLRLVSSGARDLRRSGDLSRSSLRLVRREVDLLQAQMRLLGGDDNRLDRLADRMLLLQNRMRDSRTSAGGLRRSLSRLGEGGLGGLRPLVQGLSLLGRGFGRVREAVSGASRAMKMFLLVLGLIGPLAAPVGAILTTVLGGAFVALGAFALRGEKDVRSAFSRMTSSVGSSVRAAAQPLRGPLVRAMNEVGTAVQGMQGELTAAFTATAPLVSNLVGAFTDLASRALPGIIQSLQAMGPVIAGFRDSMGTIGEGLGNMFAAMTSGGGAEGLADSWRVMGREIKILLVNMGQFINAMSQSESATALLVGMFRALSGILFILEGAFEAVDRTLVPLVEKLNSLGSGPSGLESLGKLMHALGISTSDAGEVVTGFVEVNKSAAEAARDHASGVRELTEQIQGLANLNRDYLDSQAAQNEAFNKAKEEASKYADALKFTNGELDLTGTTAQEAYALLSDMAKSTNDTTNAAMAASKPWEQIRANWQNSFNDLVALADGMGLTKTEARQLAEEILGIPPSKEVYLEARVKQAREDIQSVIAAFEAAPDSETVTVEALTADAEAALERMGFTITHLPDGKTQVTTATGSALQAIEILLQALMNLDGTTVDTFTNHHVNTYRNYFTSVQPGSKVPVARRPDLAQGGPVRGYAGGGSIQHFPDGGYVQGPGTSMSDSIFATFGSGSMAAVSNTEYVVRSQAVRKYGVKMLDRLNEGRLPVTRLAKGGPTKAQKEAKKELLSSFGISHFGTMAGYQRDPFEKSLGAPESLSALVSSLNQLRSQIKKIFSGSKENSLLKQLDKWGKSLIKWQKQLRDVEKSLEKARDKLKSLKEEAKQLSESVKSGVLSSSNITKSAQGEGPVTVASLMGDLTASRDKATAFASALKQLQKMGLRSDLIQQIAEAGVEGGGLETAGALLSASGSEISSINQLQSQIASAAGSAGKTTADAVFGGAIKLQTMEVKKLEATQRNLTKSMEKLAKVMEKALKKALGGKAAGGPVGAASGGARGSWTLVGEHEPELVRLPYGSRVYSGPDTRRIQQQAWASMLNQPQRRSARADAAAAPVVVASEPMVIQLKFGERQLGEVVVDVARKEVRARGGIEAAFKPPRGR